MGALQKVFDTIWDVLEIIKDFFNKLFPKTEEGKGDANENA